MQADYSNTEQVISNCKTSDIFNSYLLQVLAQTQTIILTDDSQCFTKSPTSPRSGGRSVGIVRSRIQTMEFFFFFFF
jgi:hypothetical protein